MPASSMRSDHPAMTELIRAALGGRFLLLTLGLGLLLLVLGLLRVAMGHRLGVATRGDHGDRRRWSRDVHAELAQFPRGKSRDGSRPAAMSNDDEKLKAIMQELEVSRVTRRSIARQQNRADLFLVPLGVEGVLEPMVS